VAGPVGHVLDQAAYGTGRSGPHLVEQGADGGDDLDVGLLVPAADVVGLADAALASTSRIAAQWSVT
jgi:hypothetical protein